MHIFLGLFSNIHLQYDIPFHIQVSFSKPVLFPWLLFLWSVLHPRCHQGLVGSDDGHGELTALALENNKMDRTYQSINQSFIPSFIQSINQSLLKDT